jgi:hypothetical protein
VHRLGRPHRLEREAGRAWISYRAKETKVNRFAPLSRMRHCGAYCLCSFALIDETGNECASVPLRGVHALVQANPRHWFYLRKIRLPTLSATDQ